MPLSLHGYRRREMLAIVCLGLAGLLVVSAYLPPVVYLLWMVRFFARELSLFACLLSALALVLLAKAPPSGSLVKRGRVLALAALLLVLGALPLAATLPLFNRQRSWFSIGQYVGFSADRSAAAQIVEEHDVVLAADRPELLVDVYRPAAAGDRPGAGAAVVVVHGGSFQRGDKGDVSEVSRALAESGYAVFDLRYRLAPQHPFPAALQDILCIVGRLAEPSAQTRYGVDARRIALLGRSAGGTLALSAAYAAAVTQHPAKQGALAPALRAGCAVVDVAPAAVVAIYSWTNLNEAYEAPPRLDPLDTPQVIRAYLGGPASQLAGPYRHASPVSYATLGSPLPPTLLVHGQADTLVPPQQSASLKTALTDAGHAVTHLAIPFAEHGFDHRAGGVAEQITRATILSFLGHALAAR